MSIYATRQMMLFGLAVGNLLTIEGLSLLDLKKEIIITSFGETDIMRI